MSCVQISSILRKRCLRSAFVVASSQVSAKRHTHSSFIFNSSLHKVKLNKPKSFFSVASPFGSKRKEYSEKRILGYSMEQLYEVVADVDKYKEFLPWCLHSNVTKRSQGYLKADLKIGFPPLVESYTSSVTLARPHLVKACCTDGQIFNHLETIWQLQPGIPNNNNTCTLNFKVSFEFRSLLHSHLSHVFFNEVARTMVNAFLQRTEQLYGKPCIRQTKTF